MAATVNNQIQLLDVAQRQKETSINLALNIIDASAVPAGTAHPAWAMGPGGFSGPGGTNWLGVNSTGCVLGLNLAAGATYGLVDWQIGGVSVFSVGPTGTVVVSAQGANRCLTLNHGAGAGATIFMVPSAGNLRTNIRWGNFQMGTDSTSSNLNDFFVQNLSSGNLFLTCNATDLITIGTNNASGGVVHGVSGGKISFFGGTPALKNSAYTITSPTTNRSLNESTATLAQVAQVLGTLVSDLQNYGLI